jgi:hypothetical protein
MANHFLLLNYSRRLLKWLDEYLDEWSFAATFKVLWFWSELLK